MLILMAWNDIVTGRHATRIAREQGALRLAREKERMRAEKQAGRAPQPAERERHKQVFPEQKEKPPRAEVMETRGERVLSEALVCTRTRDSDTRILGELDAPSAREISGSTTIEKTSAALVALPEHAIAGGVLAEGMARERNGKLVEEDVYSLRVHTTPRQRQFLRKLFHGIVLPSDDVFKTVSRAREVWNALNQEFRRECGADAVLVKTLDGGGAKAGKFYWLALNNELFEAEERKPVAGIHFGVRDVFRPAQARILEYVATHEYSSVEMIAKATGVKLETAYTYVTSAINRECRRFGLPQAITGEEANPTLYCVGGEFSSLFEMKLGNGISLEIFSERERKLVEFLAGNPKSTRAQAGEFLACSAHNVALLVENINRKADLLGYKAIASYRSGVSSAHHLFLTRKFACAVKLEAKEKHELSMYFAEKEVEVIMFLKGKPGAVMREMNEALEMCNNSTHQKIKAIERKCAKHELPNPFSIESRMHGGTYSLSQEFEKMFFGKGEETVEQPAQEPDALKITTAQVYGYFQETRNSTVAGAARKLGVSEQAIREKIAALNGMLSKHGFGNVNGKTIAPS
ncbi:hypothetical protein HY992_00785 [Candidatus Micrarchaeota archaeon]|nr:hypothetical protein [Candidatus Micrarchaeota archaeon]